MGLCWESISQLGQQSGAEVFIGEGETVYSSKPWIGPTISN